MTMTGLNRDPGKSPRWIIVGHGMVAMRLLQELAACQLAQVRVTVIGEESNGGYNRIGLSDVLAGKRDEQSLATVTADWYTQNGVEQIIGRVLHIDREQKSLMLTDGREMSYDRLILATGSAPRVPNVPGCDLSGVQAFRTREDLQRLRALSSGDHAVVLGGGLLGLEAAVGLAGRGVTVTVVHRADWLMNRQMDERAAGWLAERLQEQGIELITGAELASIDGNESVQGVHLTNGQYLSAEAVVLAIGIRPRTELAKQAGLILDRGILVDDQMTTSDPDISALGECASHRGVTYGLVAPLYEQANVLARHLCGHDVAYTGSSVSTRLKVSGVSVFSAGEIPSDSTVDSAEWRDDARREYRRLFFDQGRLVGAVLYGDATEGPFFHRLINEQQDVTDLRPTLIFGERFVAASQTSEPTSQKKAA